MQGIPMRRWMALHVLATAHQLAFARKTQVFKTIYILRFAHLGVYVEGDT
jgi:hypothetical protein